jgi:hypothetical protein
MLLSYHVMAWVIQPLLIYVNNIVVISTLSQEYEAQVKALKEKQKKAAEAETGIGRFKIQMGFQFKGLGFYQPQTVASHLILQEETQPAP